MSADEVFEESAEDLLDNAPCGYLSTRSDGVIVRVNATLLRWTGYGHDELVGSRKLADILTPGGRIYYETHYAPMLQMQGYAREIAIEFMRADGTRLPALVSSTKGLASDGVTTVVRTIVFDATERRRYEQELVAERTRAEESEARAKLLVATLQESLIPPEPSQIPGLQVAGAYRPAGAGDVVGGDFYDVFETPRSDWVAFVGDVMGKGAAAARVTAAARYTLRATAMRSAQPRDAFAALNQLLCLGPFDRFCTAVCAHVARVNGDVRVTVAVAGHPLPVLVGSTGEVRNVGRTGTLLGAFEDAAFEDVTIALSPGSALVLYTDGVTEARRSDGEFFGERRLAELLAARAGSDADRMARAVVDDVVRFDAGTARDDVAILVMSRPERS